MPFYPGVVHEFEEQNDDDSLSKFTILRELIKKILPEFSDDLHHKNFRKAKDGTLICVDLGFGPAS
jgi:hypothetical protein